MMLCVSVPLDLSHVSRKFHQASLSEQKRDTTSMRRCKLSASISLKPHAAESWAATPQKEKKQRLKLGETAAPPLCCIVSWQLFVAFVSWWLMWLSIQYTQVCWVWLFFCQDFLVTYERLFLNWNAFWFSVSLDVKNLILDHWYIVPLACVLLFLSLALNVFCCALRCCSGKTWILKLSSHEIMFQALTLDVLSSLLQERRFVREGKDNGGLTGDITGDLLS